MLKKLFFFMLFMALALSFTGCSVGKSSQVDSFDYHPYLKKIWVIEEWNGGASYHLSFVITKVENGIMEGKFTMPGIMNPCIHLPSYGTWGNFAGEIRNGVAECFFTRDDRNRVGGGYQGKVSFKLKNESIEATIEYPLGDTNFTSGTYRYRPYNFTDLAGINQGVELMKKDSFPVDLKYWGTVNLVTGVSSLGEPYKEYPRACLTDADDNVLCDFFENIGLEGEKIVDIKIEPYKSVFGDGLKAIKIIVAPINDETGNITANQTECVEWVYYQVDDGWFYVDNPY